MNIKIKVKLAGRCKDNFEKWIQRTHLLSCYWSIKPLGYKYDSNLDLEYFFCQEMFQFVRGSSIGVFCYYRGFQQPLTDWLQQSEMKYLDNILLLKWAKGKVSVKRWWGESLKCHFNQWRHFTSLGYIKIKTHN